MFNATSFFTIANVNPVKLKIKRENLNFRNLFHIEKCPGPPLVNT